LDKDLYVRTQYDGKDYMSVEEIFYIDEDGSEVICKTATEACIDITTCADQGTDLWSWLESQIKLRLKNTGITYSEIFFEN